MSGDHRIAMRGLAALLLVAAFARSGPAACPPDCVAGGGPAATDCFVAYGGITAASDSCTDGAPCDVDGRANGVCTFALQACTNVAGLAGCIPSTLSGAPTVTGTGPVAASLASALAALDPTAQGCTPPGLAVPLKISAAGIKRATARLTVSATSSGKKDKDRLKLTCEPSTVAPTLSGDVQPIFTAKCAIPACHSGPSPSAGQSLEAGQSWGSDVGVHATNNPKLTRVVPSNVKKSYLAKKVLGPTDGTAVMPQGCPGVPPAGGCLTEDEKVTILYWIANGAPND